jgi:hypothetical protein
MTLDAVEAFLRLVLIAAGALSSLAVGELF